MKSLLQSGRINIKLLISVVIIAGVASLVGIYYSVDQVNLSSGERDNIADACNQCHRNPERLSHNASKVHNLHTSADCMSCHVGTDGLKTADNAHDIIEWVGIGMAGATILGLGANYFIARNRIRKAG